MKESKVVKIEEYNIDDDVFSRQVLVDGWNQKKIEASKVLIVGAGALGNEIVKNLVLSGIGVIYVLDFDKVVFANLNRCIFYLKEDASTHMPKTDALAKNARRIVINPRTQIIPINGDLLEMNEGEEWFRESDVYVSALDNIVARLDLNIKALMNKKPLVDGGMRGFHGYVRAVLPGKTACLECNTDKEAAGENLSCSGRMLDDGTTLPLPSLSTTTSVIAGIQSQEVLKLLLDPRGERFNTLAGKILYYIGETNYISILEVERRSDCICNDFPIS